MTFTPSVRTISKDSLDKHVLEVASWFPENRLLAPLLNCSSLRAKYSFSDFSPNFLTKLLKGFDAC